VCAFFLPKATLFVSLVYFLVELSVAVQVIAWKDSCPKWPFMGRVGHKTLLTHSPVGTDLMDVICHNPTRV